MNFVLPYSESYDLHKVCRCNPWKCLQKQGCSNAYERSCGLLAITLGLTPDEGEDSDEVVEVAPNDAGKVAGLAFKLMTDHYVVVSLYSLGLPRNFRKRFNSLQPENAKV